MITAGTEMNKLQNFFSVGDKFFLNLNILCNYKIKYRFVLLDLNCFYSSELATSLERNVLTYK